MATDLKDKMEVANAAQEAGASTVPARQGATVFGWLTDAKSKAEIQRALPHGMDADRFMRILQTEVRKNPLLLEATPQSFMLGVINLAQLGLEPGPLGHAYLTGPFRNGRTGLKEVLPIIGYKGLKELAYRADTVEFIDAVTVHEGEPFRVIRGSEQRLEHEEVPDFAEAPAVAYYAIAFPKGSTRPVFDVMWPHDIEAIRKRSKAKDDGPWKTDYEAMALKTVTRRLLNRGKVRLSPQIQAAIVEDEARELGFEKPEVLEVIDGQAQTVDENGEVREPSAESSEAKATAEAEEPQP